MAHAVIARSVFELPSFWDKSATLRHLCSCICMQLHLGFYVCSQNKNVHVMHHIDIYPAFANIELYHHDTRTSLRISYCYYNTSFFFSSPCCSLKMAFCLNITFNSIKTTHQRHLVPMMSRSCSYSSFVSRLWITMDNKLMRD